jgi:hypothetical protein
MSQLQYIADGYNKSRERVVLWRLGNYQYQLEVAGKNTDFTAEYYTALERFKSAVIEVVEAPEDFVTVA